ncbi:hypothetical protein BDZ45DRAFT_730668 [Acephala macrosclerotiorum]|nr:hypothetical protein BDZ45DRAFT_730668 [Acephala macrosclerotiorum]
MLANTVIMLTLAATGFSQVPAGYRTVYLSSMVNTKLVIAPKNPVKSGTTIVVQTLNNKPDQQWYLNDGNSTIRLAATTFCLDAGAKRLLRDRSRTTMGCYGRRQDYSCSIKSLRVHRPSIHEGHCEQPGLYSRAGLGNIGAKDTGINWPQSKILRKGDNNMDFLGRVVNTSNHSFPEV